MFTLVFAYKIDISETKIQEQWDLLQSKLQVNHNVAHVVRDWRVNY